MPKGIKKDELVALLQKWKGNITRVAEATGLTRRGVHDRITHFKINIKLIRSGMTYESGGVRVDGPEQAYFAVCSSEEAEREAGARGARISEAVQWLVADREPTLHTIMGRAVALVDGLESGIKKKLPPRLLPDMEREMDEARVQIIQPALKRELTNPEVLQMLYRGYFQQLLRDIRSLEQPAHESKTGDDTK